MLQRVVNQWRCTTHGTHRVALSHVSSALMPVRSFSDDAESKNESETPVNDGHLEEFCVEGADQREEIKAVSAEESSMDGAVSFLSSSSKSTRSRSRRVRQQMANERLSMQIMERIVHDPHVDYEHGLTNTMKSSQLKERKYRQAISRSKDHKRACRNCGQIGHVARNCLLPTICSNCGELGHYMTHCPHPVVTMEQYAQEIAARDAQTQNKKKISKQVEETDASQSDPVKVTDEKKKIKAKDQRDEKVAVLGETPLPFEDEIDEFLTRSERIANRRRAKQKEAAAMSSTIITS